MREKISDSRQKLDQCRLNNTQNVREIVLVTEGVLSGDAKMAIDLENYRSARSHMAANPNDLDVRSSSRQE